MIIYLGQSPQRLTFVDRACLTQENCKMRAVLKIFVRQQTRYFTTTKVQTRSRVPAPKPHRQNTTTAVVPVLWTRQDKKERKKRLQNRKPRPCHRRVDRVHSSHPIPSNGHVHNNGTDSDSYYGSAHLGVPREVLALLVLDDLLPPVGGDELLVLVEHEEGREGRHPQELSDGATGLAVVRHRQPRHVPHVAAARHKVAARIGCVYGGKGFSKLNGTGM